MSFGRMAAGCAILFACDIAFARGTLTVESGSFRAGAPIPEALTCDGGDSLPSLRWSGAPAGTKSFAILVDDPDAPGGTFTHWLLFDVPPTVSSIDGSIPTGAKQGKNDFGNARWNGPCPPPGRAHHYHFRVLALDSVPSLPDSAPRAAVDRALQSHVLAQGEIVGTYFRKKH